MLLAVLLWAFPVSMPPMHALPALFGALAETALDFFTVDDLIRMVLKAAQTRMKEAN